MKKYKFFKVMFIVESCIIALAVCVFSLMIALDNNRETLLTESISEGGSTVEINEIGKPFLFGASRVGVRYTFGGTSTEFKARICNDGAPIGADKNCRIEWEGETAVITLHGCEQPDETYRLQFSRTSSD